MNLNEIVVLAFLCCVAYLITRSICALSVRRQWLDTPIERSSHTIPTPKSGGGAFVLTFLSAVLYFFFEGSMPAAECLALLVASLVAITGLIDDSIHLSIKVRIVAHLFAVCCVLLLLGGAPDISFYIFTLSFQTGWLIYVGFFCAALVFVWVINLYNFMDGLDGLAASEAIFVCVAASIIIAIEGGAKATEDSYLLLCLAFSVLGFLILNLPPAKIFMGDIGSNFLGFTLGVVGLITIKHGVMDVWSWGILLGIFVVDGTATLIHRMRSNEVWYHAHRSHAYQRAALKYSSHGKVVFSVLLLNVFWLFPLAWLNARMDGLGIGFLFLAYIPLILIGQYYRNNTK